jgi:hypothetical protein
VRARQGRERTGEPLVERFQIAVDYASMRAEMTESDAYLSLLRWDPPIDREGTLEEVANQVAAELEEQYKKIDWRKTVKELRQQ